MNAAPQETLLDSMDLKRLYELWPTLVDFDQKTGEIALFKETLEGVMCALPDDLDKDLIVIGYHVAQVLAMVEGGDDPSHSAAFCIMRAHNLRK